MWREITLFELRYQVRQPLFAASSVLFFLLALALASSDVGTALGDAPGTSLRNAPITVVRLMPVLSLLGLFVVTAFVASAALRDFERRSDALFLTKPIGKLDYLAGRFAGSMGVSLLVLLAAVLGLMVGGVAPWQPADRLGAFVPSAYGFGVLTIVIPNLLIMGALFFALAIWSRKLSVTYLCVVLFIGMQDAVELVAEGLESKALGSLLDPSGVVAVETMARYWTLDEQAVRLPELGGVLLANRLGWLAVALLVLLASFTRFRVPVPNAAPRRQRWWHRGRKRPPTAAPEETPAAATGWSGARRSFSIGGHLGGLLRQARIEASDVLKGPAFLTLLAFGLLFVAVFAWVAGSQDGTPSYPLTHLMLEAIELGARVTLVLMVALYAGQLVFRQRGLELSQVYDALPVPSWMFLGAKLAALVGVIAVFLLAATTITVSVQAVKGASRFEPGLYLQGLAVIAWPIVLLAVLALFLQVLAGHRLWGLLLTGLAVVLRFALPRVGLEDNLYLYASHPPITYTDINGYGHHAEPFLWFMTYWSSAAAILIVGSLLLWPRGTETSWRGRLAVARGRLTPPMLSAIGVAIAAMLALGFGIYRETHGGVGYIDRGRITGRLADYERKYAAEYRGLPVPRVTSVHAEVDLYPDDRRALIRARYRLENQSSEATKLIPVTLSPRWVEGVLRVYGGVSLEGVELPDHTVRVTDPSLGFYVYELEEPLAPGASMEIGFTVRVEHDSLANRRHNDLVVANGTFFSNRSFLPVLGYAASNQLWNPAERRKWNLPEAQRMPSLDDASARRQNYLEADWISFEAVLSTDADQIAVTVGDLEREWSEGGRRYFHYKTKAPVVNLLPFLSGRYEVARDRWRDVAIEVYHHPNHDVNIDRFIEVTKRSLAYMTEHFGPYPHGQLRILEIPRYHGEVAFAFAQTIPFSESWSFTADLEAGELDWLTGILAHEVAHQWWNHQLVPADAQGSTLIAESLAQYAAMRILEETAGPEQVHEFLEFHLDRYLDGRGHETRREMPLVRVENQAYIHYSKASLAFYALEERIGETALNGALRAFLEDSAFSGPPFPTARDLLARLEQVVPEGGRGLLEDLFETITLYDNRVETARVAERPDGRFTVQLETSSTKLRDDGRGRLTEIPMDDWVDIGIFAEDQGDGASREVPLVLERRRLGSGKSSFTFVVDRQPARAGIDPHHKLVDRDSGDNVRSFAQGPGR